MPDMSVTLPVGVIMTLAVGYIHLVISSERSKLLLKFSERCDELERTFANKIHDNTKSIELHAKDIQNINSNLIGINGRLTTIDGGIILLRDADTQNRHSLRNEYQEHVGKMFLILSDAQKELRNKVEDLQEKIK